MSGGNGAAPERLPTLTEVIELSQTQTQTPMQPGGTDAAPAVERRIAATAVSQERRVAAPPMAARPALADDEIVQRVVEELHRQIDLMLEYRLREALAPVLARAADNMVRETRTELASTLRDVVARAVALEMARHRARQSGR